MKSAPAASRVWRRCPVCATERGEPYLAKGPLRIVRCSRCGMLFANPVEERYLAGTFYEELATPFYLAPDKLEGDYSPVRFTRELRVFRRHCPSGDVLDVGCSTGAFLRQLQQKFPGSYQVLGTDVAGPALDYAASQGIPVLRAPFLDHDFGQTQFDAVTFWAVLEHLAEPKQFLVKAASLVRPGGHCFLLVPNMGSLAARWLRDRYRYLMPEHLNYFHRGTLQRLLDRERAWEIVRLKSSHFNPVVLWQDWRRGRGGFVPPAERARLLKRTNAWKQSGLLLPFRLGYWLTERLLAGLQLGDNLLLVARRK